MAIQLTGQGQTAAIAADATFQALKISPRPMEALNWTTYCGKTGALTTTAAWTAAGVGAIFSLRNAGPNLVLVRRVQIGFLLTTAFSTAQMMDYALIMGRVYTSAPTSGTVLTATGGNCRHRSNTPAPNVNISIATTAGLTTPAAPNTKIFDANFLSYVNFWAGAIGQNLPPSTMLFDQGPGDFPIVLRVNEGIEIVNVSVMGTTGVGTAMVTFEYAEVLPSTFTS